jgi:hypothetical protein
MVSEPQTSVIEIFQKVIECYGGSFDLSRLPTNESKILRELMPHPITLDPHMKLVEVRGCPKTNI